MNQEVEVQALVAGTAATLPKNGTRQYLLATHVNPDGDAIGSTLALAEVIARSGGVPIVYLPTGIPDYLEWLPVSCRLVQSLSELGDWRPHVLVTLDCGDAERVDGDLSVFFSQGKGAVAGWDNVISVNIDHHLSNPGYADYNWIEPSWAATGELVGLIAQNLNLDLEGNLGLYLYLALVSDTGCFSFGNTSARSLALASAIVGAGLSVQDFTSNFSNNWSLARMHLWGELMGDIMLHESGRIASSVVTQKQLQKYGVGKTALEGFAAMLRKIKGVEVALFIRQDAAERCKISLRSTAAYDVSRVAACFGGGGHAAAAGAEVSLPPEKARQAILEKLVF